MLVEGTLCSLPLLDEVSLIMEGDKEEQEGIKVVLSLFLFAGIVNPVVGEDRFAEFAVHSVVVFVHSSTGRQTRRGKHPPSIMAICTIIRLLCW